MPKVSPRRWRGCRPTDLVERGRLRMERFCIANDVEVPDLAVTPKADWHVGACAYYRPTTVRICLEECARPCPEETCRLWSWPGYTVDRTPYGVVAHELGHHCDYLTGVKKWSYGSEYCEQVKDAAREPPLTGYAENPAEWFAEMFRLFVTNPYLLAAVRPKTFKVLLKRWKPVGGTDWVAELGADVPDRVVRAAKNKVT